MGINPFGIASDGANMWVLNRDGSVPKLRASDRIVLGPFPLGNIPAGIAFGGANIGEAWRRPPPQTFPAQLGTDLR
jgi:hypothetical protein